MNATVATVENPEQLIRKGWQLLVEQLGVQNATQFVVLLERGKGDSVEEIARYWGQDSIEDIFSRVSEWMSQTGSDRLAAIQQRSS